MKVNSSARRSVFFRKCVGTDKKPESEAPPLKNVIFEACILDRSVLILKENKKGKSCISHRIQNIFQLKENKRAFEFFAGI